MKKLYLVDYIGISSGMRYYHEALEEHLLKTNVVDIEILSNYSTVVNNNPFFPEIFKGTVLIRVIRLIISYVRLKRKVRRDSNSVFLFLCYGSIIDIVLMPAVQGRNNCILDIHDPIMKGKESSGFLTRHLSKQYRMAKTIIYHSESALKTVSVFGFNGQGLFVPHFPYTISKEYDMKELNNDIKNSVDREKCNVLYFGNINYSKGPDLFVNSIGELPVESIDRFNFILAGKVSDNTLDGIDLNIPALHAVLRKINDDELKFLYSNVDYIILPYRETYQSGVLEMAFKFKVPVIVTNIPYFKSVIEKYPSFGVITESNPKAIANTIITLNKKNNIFFTESDMESYNNRDEFVLFREQFKKYILSL